METPTVSRMSKRSELENQVIENFNLRLTRQEGENRRTRQEVSNLARIVENETGEEEDTEDDEGTGGERDIWSVVHVTEEDFETTEGEGQDLYGKLMEMVGWNVTDKENEKENDLILV